MKAVALSYLQPDKYRQPPELQHANQIERWGALPSGGGLDDEPIGYLDRCAWASYTQRAFAGRHGTKNVIGWIDSNPELFEHYAYVVKIIELTNDGWSAEDAMKITDLIVDEDRPLKEGDAIRHVRKANRGN